MSDLIGKKVFVYIDEDGHASVFPYETKEHKHAIYEAAVAKAIEWVQRPRWEDRSEATVTQADVDAAQSEAAKSILESKLADQKRLKQRNATEVERLENLLQSVKEGDEDAKYKLDEELIGYEIRLDGARHSGGEVTIHNPKDRI